MSKKENKKPTSEELVLENQVIADEQFDDVPTPEPTLLILDYVLKIMDVRGKVVADTIIKILNRHGYEDGSIRMNEAGGALQIILDQKRDWLASPLGNSNKNGAVKDIVSIVIIRGLDAIYAEIERAMSGHEALTGEDLIKIGLRG